jgi:hypothetical protein
LSGSGAGGVAVSHNDTYDTRLGDERQDFSGGLRIRPHIAVIGDPSP